ncbi:unnamed protein product [Dovyalis caffra]|uniref:Uncharacterized protein n=1 Tax=Dovyalis caffra TaxID=77055 RepID=A0AAV1R675_9ROSI|nr:unnamed protein product [Dovyalis caffra]
MANWVSAGRSTSTMMRATLRKTTKSASPSTRISVSPFSSIRLPNLTLRCHSRISSSRLVRRELSSLFPVHSAIASACLVSKLPNEVSTSSEGFAHSNAFRKQLALTDYQVLYTILACKLQQGKERNDDHVTYS